MIDILAGRQWAEEGGSVRTIDKLLIDANWSQSTNTVYRFCKESTHAKILIPFHGIGLGATKKPYSEYHKRKGDYIGHHWRIPPAKKGQVRCIHSDVNYWKSYLMEALKTPKGATGALTLWGNNPSYHRLFADQLTAEVCIMVTANERTVAEWKDPPHHPDNHFLDCTCGALMCANMLGASLNPVKPQTKTSNAPQVQPTKQRNRVSYISI